jgi:hypothetical protein
VAYTWSTIDDFAVGALAVQRKDLVRRYSINLNYQALRRVGLFAQIVRNVRTSTVRLEQFSGTAVGLGLTAAID